MEKKSISKEELNKLLRKYAIGKKPLAKLLGWGETTIVLYCGMDTIPSNEYTQTLYRLYTDKDSFWELLSGNRDKLTEVAYRKCLSKLYKPVLDSRILLIAQYLIDISPYPLSQAHLDILLIWAQILSLKFLNKPVFEDVYQPTKGNGNSPYRMVAEAYRDNLFFVGNTPESSAVLKENLTKYFNISPDKVIDDETKNILSFVTEFFSWYGERAFTNMLAAERFRLCGPPNTKNRRYVSIELMKKIYGDIFEQAKVKKLKDVESFVFKRLEAIRKKIPVTENKTDR
ncbi:MAG: hypothetical protein IK007_09140 [Lachnospiraceae bacterium]|nr:hypothetical protein [Lachnospiraceae bacterium]